MKWSRNAAPSGSFRFSEEETVLAAMARCRIRQCNSRESGVLITTDRGATPPTRLTVCGLCHRPDMSERSRTCVHCNWYIVPWCYRSLLTARIAPRASTADSPSPSSSRTPHLPASPSRPCPGEDWPWDRSLPTRRFLIFPPFRLPQSALADVRYTKGVYDRSLIPRHEATCCTPYTSCRGRNSRVAKLDHVECFIAIKWPKN